jgi:hypothetical protein
VSSWGCKTLSTVQNPWSKVCSCKFLLLGTSLCLDSPFSSSPPGKGLFLLRHSLNMACSAHTSWTFSSHSRFRHFFLGDAQHQLLSDYKICAHDFVMCFLIKHQIRTISVPSTGLRVLDIKICYLYHTNTMHSAVISPMLIAALYWGHCQMSSWDRVTPNWESWAGSAFSLRPILSFLLLCHG